MCIQKGDGGKEEKDNSKLTSKFRRGYWCYIHQTSGIKLDKDMRSGTEKINKTAIEHDTDQKLGPLMTPIQATS